jgi:hypothetical protein
MKAEFWKKSNLVDSKTDHVDMVVDAVERLYFMSTVLLSYKQMTARRYTATAAPSVSVLF